MKYKRFPTRIILKAVIFCLIFSILPVVEVKTSKADVNVESNDQKSEGIDIKSEGNGNDRDGVGVEGESTDQKPVNLEVSANEGVAIDRIELDIDREDIVRTPQDDAGKKTEDFVPIRNAADLIKLRDDIQTNRDFTKGKKYKLLDNIDLSNYCSYSKGDWKPIGIWESDGHAFYGEFDGLGYTISGLYIGNGQEGVGLFGALGNGGIVKNLVVEGTVYGTYNVGGIVGVNGKGGLIQNCLYKGTVTATKFVGGVVGFCTGGGCKKAKFTGTVSGNDTVGGISGDASIKGLEECIASGIINCKKTKAGGIAGETAAPLTKCVSYCNVYSEIQAGGITGRTYECSGYVGDIEKCINKGNIKAKKNVGGIVGEAKFKVADCTNEGTVSGEEYYGDIIGYGDASLVTGSVIDKSNNKIIIIMLGVFILALACGIVFVMKRKRSRTELP
ncbi:MAG: hypothetical protein K5639_00825 [Eubacterium sp.]|nr:hypothetical protein [Eubacterium sp.]